MANLDPNLALGWSLVLLGLATGAVLGLRFHVEGWLGGSCSWRRRLLRLGHVALIGTGLLNVTFAASRGLLSLPAAAAGLAGACLALGAVTMPIVCLAAALRPRLRHVFPVPVGLLVAGVALATVGALR